MKRKLIVGAAIVAVFLASAAAYFMTRGPDLSAYEKFREPAMINKANQKVIVVEATGNPETVGGEAFKLLFKLYFQLEGVPKGPAMPAPRARWPKIAETPKDQWLGRYAMPVPDSVTALPQAEAKAGLAAKLDTWTYGEVGQILHVGPYDKETPTIQKLLAFIADRGYEIAGEHEEEYLRGPTMFGKGDPEKYYTLIRYPVRPVE